MAHSPLTRRLIREGCERAGPAPLTVRERTMLESLVAIWAFASMRSEDDSKTFARVNRGALRTIAAQAKAAIALAEARS